MYNIIPSARHIPKYSSFRMRFVSLAHKYVLSLCVFEESRKEPRDVDVVNVDAVLVPGSVASKSDAH